VHDVTDETFADEVLASVAGSWSFISAFLLMLGTWIALPIDGKTPGFEVNLDFVERHPDG